MTSDGTPRIPEERLARYRELADRGLWDISDDYFRAFYQRALAEGVELVENDPRLGMFRAPWAGEPGAERDLDGVDVALVGIPMDIGVPNPRPGTRLGPKELRYWSLDRNMVNVATRVCPFEIASIVDWGDVVFRGNPYDLVSNLDEITELYADFAERGIAPLTIGGEHTCTYAILRALSQNGERPLAVIHLDAHGDTSVQFGGTRVSDGSIFQVAAVEGFIDPELTIQIGLRGRGVMRCDFSHDSGMSVVMAEELQEKGARAIAYEAKQIVGDRPAYLTIDTDVFDPSAMPGTTLPEPFGLTGVEVRDFLRAIRGTNLVGADLMELSPPWDATGKSACLAAGVAFEELCVLAEVRGRGKTHWR